MNRVSFYFIFGAMLVHLTTACTVNEKLLVRPKFPVLTTIELKRARTPAPLGKIVCIAGEMTACNEAFGVVILDDEVECFLTAYEGDVLANVMKSYSGNVGAAVAIRGVLSKSTNSRYPYRLQPSAHCVMERDEAKRKLLAEKSQRPLLRFTPFYGGLGQFGAIWNEHSNLGQGSKN